MRHRWPKSIHSQIEAVFHSLKSIGKKKAEVDALAIRGLGTWHVYRQDAHRFGDFLARAGISDLLDSVQLERFAREYLATRWQSLRTIDGSYQTFEREAQALAKLSDALGVYAAAHKLEFGGGFRGSIAAEKALAKEALPVRSASYENRAYPDPAGLIAALADPTHKLQARLQVESGCRAEGVGAPARGRNPLTTKNLCGIVPDPVTGLPVGSISVVEKGGKHTTHFLSARTYQDLTAHLEEHGKLESSFRSYVRGIESAARLTGQYAKGRGTHGLKHSFAQMRFTQGVQQGLSHEEAKQATAFELAHNRLDVTDGYLR